MKKKKTFLIYLADLAHDYFNVNLYTPTGIGYLASYSISKLGDQVDFKLFKSTNKLLEEVDKKKPDLVGLSNYTWNQSLSKFAGRWIKQRHPFLPIIMGGPNIRLERPGIENFLRTNEYVDTYCMFAGEISVYKIVKFLLNQSKQNKISDSLRGHIINGCYSIFNNKLVGNSDYEKPNELDDVPSPFLTGMMDTFLGEGYYPIVETNRGCPFSCTFCVWGISALNKVLKFSMDRVKSELSYIAKSKYNTSVIVLADANFGILPRDAEIAQHMRDMYDQNKSFSSIRMYWAKISKPQIVEIGRILGQLTRTYIAFQSLDDKVLENIKRKNIRTSELLDMIEKLKGFSYGAQTDFLVGLPGETYQSHLNSLEKALSMGIDHILGGEVELLPGSEMDSEDSRKRFGLKTKYRLIEGAYGVYKDQFVYETQENIRQTNDMTEKEMLKLRVIRAFFFASVTLGEHLPLVNYLTKKKIPFTKVCEEMVEEGKKDPVFKKSVNWLVQQSLEEFYSTQKDIENYVSIPKNKENLLKSNQFVKLNSGFFAKICLDKKQYEAYYQVLKRVLLKLLPNYNSKVITDLLYLCKERNYFMRCKSGKEEKKLTLSFSTETMNALFEAKIITAEQKTLNPNSLSIEMDPVVAKYCIDLINNNPQMSVLLLSQTFMLQMGRFFMNPVFEKRIVPINSSMDDGWSGYT